MMQDFCFVRKVFGEDFLYERHINYLLKSLKKSTYGAPLEVAEAHRLSSLFFVVSGLDLLGALDTRLTPADKDNIIQWIYSYQVDVDRIFIPNNLLHPSSDEDANINEMEVESDPEDHHKFRTTFNATTTTTSSTTTTTTTSTITTTTNNNNTTTTTTTTAATAKNNNSSRNNDNNCYIDNITNNGVHINNYDNDHYHNNLQQNNHQKSLSNQRAKHIHLTKRVGHAGFRATSMINSDIPLDFGVLPMTYCALATLVILGDDLKNVDKKSILEGMRQLQSSDGSFMPTIFGGETDMRLVYCAAAVSELLNDWSGIDRDRCAKFIRSSLTYEGAFGQCPGAEAHGGSTFCALASLKLMSKLEDTLSKQEVDRLIRWCLMRFENGFCGRPNKDEDTCYSFWIGACLVMLDHFHFIEQKKLLDFILMAQEERGGLAKVPDFYSDPIHTYLGFAGLTFIDDDLCSKRGVKLLKLDPTLNISARARAYLDKLNVVKRIDLTSVNCVQEKKQQLQNKGCAHQTDKMLSSTTIMESKKTPKEKDDDDSGKDEDEEEEEEEDIMMT